MSTWDNSMVFPCQDCQYKGITKAKMFEVGKQIFCEHKVYVPAIGYIDTTQYGEILMEFGTYVNIKHWLLTDDQKKLFPATRNLRIRESFDVRRLNVLTPDCSEDFDVDVHLVYLKFKRSTPRKKYDVHL